VVLIGLTGLSYVTTFRAWKMSLEARDVNCGPAAEWLSSIWPKLCEGHPDSNISTADQTGLFSMLSTERTLTFKGEKVLVARLQQSESRALSE
jgi:hypothetical protein